MRILIGILAVLAVAMPLHAQTINGESNYEDGNSHITPEEMKTRLDAGAKETGARPGGRPSPNAQPAPH